MRPHQSAILSCIVQALVDQMCRNQKYLRIPSKHAKRPIFMPSDQTAVQLSHNIDGTGRSLQLPVHAIRTWRTPSVSGTARPLLLPQIPKEHLQSTQSCLSDTLPPTLTAKKQEFLGGIHLLRTTPRQSNSASQDAIHTRCPSG